MWKDDVVTRVRTTYLEVVAVSSPRNVPEGSHRCPPFEHYPDPSHLLCPLFGS